MLTCKEITELATEYLEGELPRRKRLAVHVHLWMCRHCRRYVDQMRTVAGMLRGLPNQPPPPEVLDALLPHFREKRDKPA
jgi:predicted anti-sigma-YlaC factor YlaD